MSVVVGLTGGIGSGKSTVARMLAALGATVIDADAIVHELQAPGMPMVAELAEAFGPGILDSEGALDRKALGDIVFRDEAARERLGQLVHPKVGQEFARRLQAALSEGVPLVVLDIPLLYEGRESGRGSGAASSAEAVIVVWIPESVQIERQMKRDGCDRAEAERRVASQLSLERKRELADHVIDNSGSLEATEAQVKALYARLTGAAPSAR
ncbi:MAG: dephospho-CoA kinase [Myxococcota bacterium]